MTKTAVKWYRAAEAKKGRTIHLAGHARLGASFAKCGKTLGRVVSATDAKYFDPCAACAIEMNKALARDELRQGMEYHAAKELVHPKTPELDRMAAVKGQSQAIGEFLEWVASTKGWVLAKAHVHGPKCAGWDSHRRRFNPGFDEESCRMGPDGRLWMEPYTKENLLAEFFGIDLNKVEAERRAMLDAIRAAA